MKLFGRDRALLALGVSSLLLLTQAGLSASAATATTFRQPPGSRSSALTTADTARSRLLAQLVTAADGEVPTAAVLRSHGFVLVSTPAPAAVQAASVNSNVTVSTPYVYFDTTRYRYTAVAKYSWDGHYWEKSDGNIGGDDGFALRFDRKMGNNGVTGTFSGRGYYYGSSPQSSPSDNSSYGVGYQKQDTAKYLAGGKYDYNMFSGSVTMDVTRPSCGTTTRLYSQYQHTWSSTSVNGFDISIDGFGVQWSSTSNKWSASSQAGIWTVSC